MPHTDILIVGAGAAGLTAAIFAAGSGKQVTILERAPQPGRKILMSGGTRCNVLPAKASVQDFVTESSRNRLRNIFKSWPVDHCRQWFEQEIGLPLVCEEATNKWFPESNSARQVRDLLVSRAESLGIHLQLKTSVEEIRREEAGWQVTTAQGEHFTASRLIVASGGMSIPSTGTDGTGHRIIQKLGHSLHSPYPALTPLKGRHPGSEPLPGISLDVDLTPEGPVTHPFNTRRTGFVFTHHGFSGPAVLDLSHVIVRAMQRGKPAPGLAVNWARIPADEWQQHMDGKQDTTSMIRRYLPKRLADNLLKESSLADLKSAELSKKQRSRLLADLTAYRLRVTGHHGYKKAEVTGGGVPLEEIDPSSMASQITPGLFLCGEILDVFGRIGGFNFYWAWVTGRLAGIAAGEE